MVLSSRIVLTGRSEHAHEQEALVFIRKALPDTEPYHLWELAELVHPSQPRLLEIDALIVGYSAIYLVEIKGGPGRYTGDSVDWVRTTPEGQRREMDAPLRGANAKARILKSLLESRLKGVRAPYVQALVFLSHEQVVLDLDDFGKRCVVRRNDFARAITHHEFPGADTSFIRRGLDIRTVREVVQALRQLGFREGKRALKVGGYQLGQVLEDGDGYQDRHAVHSDAPTFQRRARIYLVPQQTSVERRQHLVRCASRDAQLLESVKDHPGVLRLADYVQDAPLGPTLLFDHFPGVPLDAFLRRHPELPLDKKIELVMSIGAALGHCHRKDVIHGALCPGAVLVAEDGPKLVTRLYNFQLGRSDHVQATQHWSSHADDPSSVYRAPELRSAPDLISAATDVFSLGALTYFVLTGAPPGRDVAEVDAILDRGEQVLDPRTIRDCPESIANVVKMATRRVAATREIDSVEDFLFYLEEAATTPDKQRGEVSPLDAKKDDYLGEGLLVQSVLGHGASSRVLKVVRESDDRTFALKVALTDTDDERLAEEARLLELLPRANIVQIHPPVMRLGGRSCLLMALAGDQTLQQALLREGVTSLDYAARYGEELLLALHALEEAQILHRDIKPGNLGVGTAQKTALHLTLFDFSLAIQVSKPAQVSPSVTNLRIGTAAYRDPYLHLRGAWDHAADRWGAAITLHEMLTGVRPSVPNGQQGALDPSVQIELAAERFDTSVRDRLLKFFKRAFDPHVEARFESADQMRKAFNLCFEQGVITAHGDTSPADPSQSPIAVGPETPIASLPLTTRAISALDRAGLLHAGELMALPENRLSAVRGVGRQVIREILQFREQYREKLAQAAAEAAFDPAFQGYGRPLGESELEPAIVRQLVDAGLGTTDRLAQAPRAQLEHLSHRGGFGLGTIEALLKAETRAACDRQHPTTINAWIDALLPKSGRVRKHLMLLWGLEEPFRGRIDVQAAELAKHLDCTTTNIHMSLTDAERQWREHPELDKLVAAVRSVVTEAGGPLPVKRAAEALWRLIPPVASDDRSLDLARSAALLRVVCRVDDLNALDSLSWERLPSGLWICTTAVPALLLKELGQTADELASRVPLPSAAEVERRLREVVADTKIAELAAERLIELAAESSGRTARSPRLELYPKNLEAQRAIKLSGATLGTTALDPDELQRRIYARYPEAEPLPSGPDLHALLEPLGLYWSDEEQKYIRKGAQLGQLHTSYTVGPSLTTLPTSQQARHPKYIAISEFEDELRAAIQGGRYRILSVSVTRARDATVALIARYPLQRFDLDAILLNHIYSIADQSKIPRHKLHDTDVFGPASHEWRNLRRLLLEAEKRAKADLFALEQPTLITQPGLLARYNLTDLLTSLAQAARRTAPARLLLVPCEEGPGVPKINHTLTIPEASQSELLRIPTEWIKLQQPAA